MTRNNLISATLVAACKSCSGRWRRARERRSPHRPGPQYGAAYDLQRGRPDAQCATRKVTFKPRGNSLKFSWANTLIDPTSVELKFLTHGEKLTVLGHDLSPRQAADAVLERPKRDSTARRRSRSPTYFTSGISWSADYIGIAGSGGAELNLEGFVRVENQSGEDYEDARFASSSAGSTWSKRSPNWPRHPGKAQVGRGAKQ